MGAVEAGDVNTPAGRTGVRKTATGAFRVFSNTDMSMNGPREEPEGECEGEG